MPMATNVDSLRQAPSCKHNFKTSIMPGFTVALSTIQWINLSITADFVNKLRHRNVFQWMDKLFLMARVQRVAISNFLSLIFHKAKE